MIRNIDTAVKERSRRPPWRVRCSVEAEARTTFSEVTANERNETEPNLAEAIRRRFAPLGGVDLALSPPDFVSTRPVIRPVIVVDNVISELMRDEPHPAVLAWVAAHPRAALRHLCQIRPKFSMEQPLCRGGDGAQHSLRRLKPCSPRILPGVCCRSKRRPQRATPRSCSRGGSPVIRSRNSMR